MSKSSVSPIFLFYYWSSDRVFTRVLVKIIGQFVFDFLTMISSTLEFNEDLSLRHLNLKSEFTYPVFQCASELPLLECPLSICDLERRIQVPFQTTSSKLGLHS